MSIFQNDEYLRQMELKEAARYGGRNMTELQTSRRGGGAESRGFDNPDGPSALQLSGRMIGIATRWGEGIHGKRNLHVLYM